MGREIRMVPPNWSHPVYTRDNCSDSKLLGKYIPLYDSNYEVELQKWWDERQEWIRGVHIRQIESPEFYSSYERFEEYAGRAPDPDKYPVFDGEPTHYQIYENVTEGTPISPIFSTKEEILEYLLTVGNDWDDPYVREYAEEFVERGWAPSAWVFHPDE